MKLKSLKAFLLSFCFVTLYGTTVLADDTDIYLGDQVNVIRPNLLFVLDTSDSMNVNVAGTGKSRLANMREAMHDLVLELDNINVGLMRFNGRRNGDNNTPTGGAVIFPINNLDDPISVVPSETDSIHSISVPITSSSDDATQIVFGPNDGIVSLSSTILETPTRNSIEVTETYQINSSLNDSIERPNAAFKNFPFNQIKIEDSKSAAGQRRAGLRFTNINIPADAEIVSAQVSFTANSTDNKPMSIAIRGENGVSLNAFTDDNGHLQGRFGNATSETVLWSPENWFPEQIYSTPNLNTIVTTLTKSTNGWNAGDSLVFLLEDEEENASSGAKRRAYSFNTSVAKAPTLTVTYKQASTPELQVIGLRFQGVGIPQGAEIREAHIEFVAEDPVTNGNSVSDSPTWIGIENSVDAAPYTAAADNLFNTSGGGVRSYVGWKLGVLQNPGAEDELVEVQDGGQAMDLKDMVDSVVSNPDWCGGNAMAFLVYPGSSIGRKVLKSFDTPTSLDDPIQPMPRLRIEYDTDGISGTDTGCDRQIFSYRPAHSKDDATETLVNNVVKVNSHFRTGNTLTYDNSTPTTAISGIRFPGIDVVQGATILDAYLEMTVAATDTGATALDVTGENTGNALRFEATASNISDATLRPQTTATGAISIPEDSLPGEVVRSSDLSAIISEITGRADWAAGQAINLFVAGGTNERRFASYNTDPAFSPRLVLTVAGGSEATVRQRMLQLIDQQLETLNRTPTVETLYEAALYWRGEEVYYGRHRGQGNFPNNAANPNDSNPFAHNDDGSNKDPDGIAQSGTPAGDPDRGMNFGRVSHPDSYSGGALVQNGDCSKANLDHPDCFDETIDDANGAGPVYNSPFDIAECQSNYMIFLSDGAPTQNNEAPDLIAGLVPSLPSSAACSDNPKNNNGKCANDLLKFLNEEDQSDLDGKQTVKTYTIGFNTDSSTEDFMIDLAAFGGGTFTTADTASELTGVFKAILQDIYTDVTSFAAPSLTVNAFNKLFHRNEVYFSLFEPSKNVRWDGNIKKYKICDGTDSCTLGEVVDADDSPAINADGVISSTAKSLWTSAPDGPAIKLGGAGPHIPDPLFRTIYSYPETAPPDPASPTDLGDPQYELNAANVDHYDELLGFADGDTGNEIIDLINWIRGIDIDDEDGDGSVTDTRWMITDPLHGSPLALTYGCDGGTSGTPCPDTGDNAIVKVLVGSNDGSIRMFNGSNDATYGGVEEWAFFPQQVLINQSLLKANAENDHIYGVDSTPTIVQFDSNGDAIIDPADGEYVRAYFTMRRGGNSIFALDITPDADGGLVDQTPGGITPQYMWRIDGQSSLFPEFTNLSQTWSQPKPAFVRVPKATGNGDSELKAVLIFGGGYDPAQDNGFGTSNLGNSIFIIDADTGERVWWASNDSVTDGNGDAPNLVLADMDYPIPSDIALLDTNGDGAVNRLYVGDMGGQVWRVDLDDQLGGPSSGQPDKVDNSSGARLAVLSNLDPDISNIEDHRKFFYAPDVIQVADTVFAGQDYDLVTIISGDRANPLEEEVLNRAYGLRDYLISEPLTETGQYPLREGVDTDGDGNDDLYDATEDLIQVGDTDEQEAAKSSMIASSGWYIDLTDSGIKKGEKGLSSPVILAGKLFFTTFLPGSHDPCSATIGAGRLYGLDAITAGALFEDWLEGGDDSALEKGDRVYALGSGIPSSAVPIFQKQGVTLLIGTGGGAESVDPDIALPRVRTYWYQEQ